MTTADIALLGVHQNVVLLEWGWRQAERDLDPTTAEFRVYLSPLPDVVNAIVTAVTKTVPGAEDAGVSVRDGANLRTVAATSELEVALDGAEAARFLGEIKAGLEQGGA